MLQENIAETLTADSILPNYCSCKNDLRIIHVSIDWKNTTLLYSSLFRSTQLWSHALLYSDPRALIRELCSEDAKKEN